MITATFVMCDGFQAEVVYDDEQKFDNALKRIKEDGVVSLRGADQAVNRVILYHRHIVRISCSASTEDVS